MNRNRTGPHFEALAQIENELQNSPLNYTIIKPAFFMDNFLRIITVEDGVIYIPEFINKAVKFAMISSIDIAKLQHIFLKIQNSLITVLSRLLQMNEH